MSAALSPQHKTSAKRLHTVYLALGSNRGDRLFMLNDAVRRINEQVGVVRRLSSIIETEPWGYDSDSPYLNAVLRCRTMLTPQQVLKVTQEIEQQMGRTQKTVYGQYTDRPIDIDILLYDSRTVTLPDLIIPHPRMWQRSFVMEPLKEIMPRRQYERLLERRKETCSPSE